jgi:hypothetical protein
MYTNPMKSLRILFCRTLTQATLLCCCLSPAVQAADNDRFHFQDSEGFIQSLPNVSKTTVTQRLQELQQDLKTELGAVKAEVKRKRFKAIDTLVTVIMPGGLLYAKLRHDSYKRSERRLLNVSDRLDEITGELIAFETANGGLMLAVVD